MSTVVLFSGGMDSYVASKLFKSCTNVHIDFNEKWSKKQRQVIEHLPVDRIEVIEGLDLSTFIAEDGVYLPNRNILMITLAQMFGDEIVLSSTRGALHPDKDSRFGLRMEDVLSYVHKRRVQVLRPFGNLTKYEIISSFLHAGGKIEELFETTSCYHPTKIECMECRSCLRRLVAFGQHGYRLDEVRRHQDQIYKLLEEDNFSGNPVENTWALRLLKDLKCSCTSQGA